MYSSSKKNEEQQLSQNCISVSFIFIANQKRIDDLNKTLQNLQGTQKEDKNSRREYFFQKVKQLEEKIQKNQITENQKFKLLNDQVEKAEDSLQQECEQRELIGEKCLKTLVLVEKNFTLQLNEEYQSRKSNEQEIFSEIDDKISQMKMDVKQDSQEMGQFEVSQIQSIEKELEDLKYYFEKEKVIRDKNTEHLIRSFGEEILRLQEFFSEEKKISEDSYETTIRLLQDLDNTIQDDLDNEKEIRSKSEKAMLKLLEETCQKIEQSLLD